MKRATGTALWVAGAGAAAAAAVYLALRSRTASAQGRDTVSALDFASLAEAPVISVDRARAAGSHAYDDAPAHSFVLDPDESYFGSDGVVAATALGWASAQRAAGHRLFVSPTARGKGRLVLLDSAPIDWPEVLPP